PGHQRRPARARRLHRRLRRSRAARGRRPPHGDWRRELVDRTEARARLWRTDRCHATRALLRLDRTGGGQARLSGRRAMMTPVMIRPLALLAILFALAAPAAGLAGGARPADETLTRHVVMVVGGHRTGCTGTAIAQNVILTAAHCVPP